MSSAALDTAKAALGRALDYRSLTSASEALTELRTLVLFQNHYAPLYYATLALYCAACCTAMRAKAPNLSTPHALALTVLTSFGGGILVPITLGKPMVLHANESVLPVMLAAWTAVNYVPGVYRLFSTNLGRIVSTTGFEIFRYHVLAGCSDLANRTLPAPMGGAYPVAIVGPLIAGLMGGCGGAFMPLSVGLDPVKSGMPWRIQSSLLASVWHHFAVHDPHAREQLVKVAPLFADEAWVRFAGILFFATVPLLHAMGYGILGLNPFWPPPPPKGPPANKKGKRD